MNGSVQISSHLDEIDAPAWPFINAEAVRVCSITGHIDSYRYEQANGGVVALWDGYHLHALAVTIRDDMNRTRCIRVLAEPKPAARPEPVETPELSGEACAVEFEAWWESEGQYVRAGGGDYEKSFAFQAWWHLYPRVQSSAPGELFVESAIDAIENSCDVTKSNSPFLQRIHHAYAQVDGSYAWPNGREGDLLRTAMNEIDALRKTLGSELAKQPVETGSKTGR